LGTHAFPFLSSWRHEKSKVPGYRNICCNLSKISFLDPHSHLQYIRGPPIVFLTALPDAHSSTLLRAGRLHHAEQKHKIDTYTSVFRMAHVHSARALDCRQAAVSGQCMSVLTRRRAAVIRWKPLARDRDGQTTADCCRNGLHENTAHALQFRVLGKLSQWYKHKHYTTVHMVGNTALF